MNIRTLLLAGATAVQVGTANFVDPHVKIGIEALRLIRRHGKSVKHLRFDE